MTDEETEKAIYGIRLRHIDFLIQKLMDVVGNDLSYSYDKGRDRQWRDTEKTIKYLEYAVVFQQAYDATRITLDNVLEHNMGDNTFYDRMDDIIKDHKEFFEDIGDE